MSASAQRVLVLCSWFPSRVQPANGNFVAKHLRLLAQHHQLWALHVEHDPSLSLGQVEPVDQQKDGYHLRTLYFGMGKVNHPLLRLVCRIFLYFKGSVALCKEVGSFSLIHVHVLNPAVITARYLARYWGIPWMATIHASGFLTISPRTYPRWWKKLLVRNVNRAQIACPVSHALADALVALGLSTQVSLIPNVVRESIFYPASPRPSTTTFKFLHISSFHAAKNVPGIMRAARQLAKTGHAFQLTIAGNGDPTGLQAYAQKLNLTKDHISFAGPLSEKAVADMMRQHHAFVLFSSYETQGVVLLEAQMCGLPIIAPNVGGIGEVLNHPSLGILVPVGDEEALYSAMYEMACQRVNFDHLAIARQSRERFGEERVRAEYLKTYSNLLRS